ncbi:MAG: hypothetical protein HYZ42_09815 [Bacteroidetes bacterium]|nr:hypothetical protein [Bacteroidota bacterium]
MSDKPIHQSEMQDRFLMLLKERLPSHHSLVDEIADTLEISIDSAYRRIRGEKIMLLDEVVKLAQTYGINLEMLSSPPNTDQVTFSFKVLNERSFTFEQYLQSQLEHFSFINQAEEKELIYAAKDFPAYYYYNIPELAAFKIFVWKKSIMGLDSYEELKYSTDIEGELLTELGRKCLVEYCKIPGFELWNDESVNSTLRQIEVYSEMGLFENPDDAQMLVDKFEELINHLEKQAEHGKKFMINETPADFHTQYDLYYNEVVLCDNSILVSVENQKMLFLTHNTLNYLHIINREYCDITYKWMTNLQKRSTIISSGSEKVRSQFFKGVRKKIEATRKKIS